MDILAKISELRNILKKKKIEVCVFTNKDPGLSSSPCPYWRTLEYLLGFKGDNGAFAIIGSDMFFFTDKRFEQEARAFLKGTGINLVLCQDSEAKLVAYVSNYFKKYSGVLVVDVRTISTRSYLILLSLPFIKILNIDILESLWTTREKLKKFEIFDVQTVKMPFSDKMVYTPREEKLNLLSVLMEKLEDNAAFLFSDSSDISWILNIRAFENKPTLLAPSFLLLFNENGYLFIQGEVNSKLKAELQNISMKDGCIKKITIFNYENFFTQAHLLLPRGTNIIHIKDNFSASIAESFQNTAYPYIPLLRDRFDIGMKRIIYSKNETDAIAFAFEEDGLAFCEFLVQKEAGNIKDELGCAKILEECRKQSQYFICDSFPTICAFAANGAIPHYEADEKTNTQITEGLLVLDFGSQYKFGTTDNTRTLLFGNAKYYEKKMYTAILKAHIYLQRVSFPVGIEGFRLDSLVRGLLYENSIDVPHGIGHGVFMLGNVHDSAPTISSSVNYSTGISIVPGMVFTIEPGVYIRDNFGIRIENTVVAVADTFNSNKMRFKPLTLCPYERELIDVEALSKDEISFINTYHVRVLNTLRGRLSEKAMDLLERRCRLL